MLDSNKITFDPDLVYPLAAVEGRINVTDDVLLQQLNVNIRRGLPQAHPYEPNENFIILVAGGPSLKTTEHELRQCIKEGGKIACVNGSYQWCIDRAIRPSAFVMLDAREFNKRFVETPVERCHYLLGSECHPAVFEMCRDRQITLWHSVNAGEKCLPILDEYYFEHKNYFPVTLGTTVTLRAISLFRMLGFTKFEIFGFDSCYFDDKHHAYAQAENDNEEVVPVWLRPAGRDDLAKRFLCSGWQCQQARDFEELVRERGETFELNVHGDGLIATMVRTGAQMEIDENGESSE